MNSPVIKWVGGKTKLLPELVRRMPKSYGRYFEPFAGGAALFFHIAPHRAVLTDKNADLIGLYSQLATNLAPVLRQLDRHRKQHSSRYYYQVRKHWNNPGSSWSDHRRAAAFIYLNKTSFNGLWRVNRASEFNVPLGRLVCPPLYDPDVIRAAADQLVTTDLRSCDYRDAICGAAAGDFAYIDPPYDPVSATASFTSYTGTRFGRDEQCELADIASELVARNVQVMLSNSDTRFVRSLYSKRGFSISRIRCPRAINSDGAKRGDVNEVIITGGYREGF